MNKIAKTGALVINLLFIPLLMLSCQEKTSYRELLNYTPVHLTPWQNQPEAPKRLVGIFVDASSPAGTAGDGKSWATAFDDIQTAIDNAENGARIYVAAGNYEDILIEKPGIELIGGYKAGELYEKSRANLKSDEWAVLNVANDGESLVQIDYPARDIHFNGGFIFRGARNQAAILIWSRSTEPPIEGITISDCRFEDNINSSDPGGGIAINKAKDIHLNRLNASGNEADKGGFIYAKNVAGLTISGGTWQNNQASSDGGALWVGHSSGIDISGQEIRDNHANAGSGGGIHIASCLTDEVNLDRIKFVDNTAKFGGAVLAVSSNNLKFSNLEFTNKNAGAESGGAIFVQDSENAKFLHSTFTGNKALNFGGAIFYRLVRGTILFDDLTFHNNEATTSGALHIQEIDPAAKITLSHSRFIGNKALGGSGGAVNADVGSAQLNFLSTTFEKNNSTAEGGAISLYGLLASSQVIIGQDVKFINNSSSGAFGGAIHVEFADGNQPGARLNAAGHPEPQLVFQNQLSDSVGNTGLYDDGKFLSVRFMANTRAVPTAPTFIDGFINVGTSGINTHEQSEHVHIE